MKFYKYTGIGIDGTVREGLAQGKNRKEAMESLVGIETITKFKLHSITFGNKSTLNKAKMAIFFSQLSYLLDAGIPMHKAIQSLRDSEDADVKQAATSIYSEIVAGAAFSMALKNLGGPLAERFFPQIEAGEHGANLETVLSEIATQLKKENRNQRGIKTAMIYPVFILIMAFGIAGFLLVSVVPSIADILYEMGGTLPYLTKLLLDISDFLMKFGIPVLAVIIALVALFIRFIRGKGRLWWDTLMLKVPILGEMIINADQINFYRSLYYMINAGIPFVPALKYSYATVQNFRFKTDMELATARIQQEGIDLASAMSNLAYISPLHLQAIRVGVEANKLQQTLADTSDELEEINAEVTERFKSMLNPLLMIVVGIVCGFIMFAMYLPMFTVMGNL